MARRGRGTQGAIVAFAALAGSLTAGCNTEHRDGGVTGAVAALFAPDGAADTGARLAREADAGRLAKQATFGATPAVIARILQLGVNGWIDEQLAATGSSYADIAGGAVAVGSCGTDNICYRNKFSREPVAMRFYADALSQPDQLRQRVALALSEILVASDVEVNSAAGLASLNQIFLANAFGRFRDILMQVTLNGYMGDYLDMADSNRAAPSENYAREMMQLFSMGPVRLAMDGTPLRDATGATLPTYGQDDIRGIARA